jgi:glycerophosphoryl diester phosphodiesterase
MYIITHRGLDPSKENYFVESSYEAFEDQLTRGFGLEFDLQTTKDSEIVISHDKNLGRISRGADVRSIDQLTADEISSLSFDNCHLASLPELIDLINEKGGVKSMHAIHIKHSFQKKESLDTLLENLSKADTKNFILFDVTVETAKYLKGKNSALNLAPSVAHPFDIERYNQAVGGTLLSVEDVLTHPALFNWVWLDEWDRTDKDNGAKKFYTKEVFQKFRDQGMRIAVVSPELHATSPSLLGGEAHQDALSMNVLEGRLREIIALNPDAICTDYPDMIRSCAIDYASTK